MKVELFFLEYVKVTILMIFIKHVRAGYEYKFKTYERNESMLRNNLTQSLVHLLRSHKGVKEFRIEDGRFKVNTVQRNRIRSRSSVSHPPVIDTSTEQTILIYDEPDFRTDDYSSQESTDRLYTKRAAPQDQYYNTRVFTMNETTPPLDTKRQKLFYNLKPDTETGNTIYRSVLSVHNTSEAQTTTRPSTNPVQPISDQVYRRYFQDISQRQLKNIRDMMYSKQDVESPDANIYKLLKIEPVMKDPVLDQDSHIKKNESQANAFKQPDYSKNENKLLSIQLNKKIPNNESDSNTSYFVSYLSDIIPIIEQQIKNGVMNFIEQSNSKKSKVDDQTHNGKTVSENVQTTSYKTESKDDIQYTLVKTLNDVYKQYEDVTKIYNVILKIHAEIVNVKNEINSKLTSFISNESSITENHNILSGLEKDLILKQEAFMAKQNEFYNIQKGFSEKQREFHVTQLKMAKNDQAILQRQKELSNQQSEIAKKQEFLTTYLKHYIHKLKESHQLENDEILPVVPTIAIPSSVHKVNVENNQEYKVTPLRPVTADKIQQIIQSNLDNSDNPTAFLIKIKNRASDSRTGNSELSNRFTEHMDKTDATQKHIDDMVYRFYFKNTSLDKIMNPNKEYQSRGIYDLVPEDIIKRLKQNHYPIEQDDLSKRFKKDREKRSLENIESGRNNTYLTLRIGKLIKGKKRENVMEKTAISIDKLTVRTKQSGKMNTLELAQSSNAFKQCVNKLLSENWAEVKNAKYYLDGLKRWEHRYRRE